MAEKKIKTKEQLDEFLKSQAYNDIVQFITHTSNAVVTSKLTDETQTSSRLAAIIDLLDELGKWAEEIPLQEKENQRYGNKAFRDWMLRLQDNSERLVTQLLSTDSTEEQQQQWKEYIPELQSYLHDAFGNATRIDYGTGHELHFECFLLCLYIMGFYDKTQFQILINKVFRRYMLLMRQLQDTYSQEPAGSHGVWGLDDYHHLPFLYGAAQLVENGEGITPSDVLTETLVSRHADEYFYMSCVNWILKEKKGHFGEHSPMLYDVTSVPHWKKVHSGMIKMYIGEVLSKWPIMQHLLFGKLIAFSPTSPNAPSTAAVVTPTIRGGIGMPTPTPWLKEGTAAPWASAATQQPATAAPWATNRPTVPMAATAAPWAK